MGCAQDGERDGARLEVPNQRARSRDVRLTMQVEIIANPVAGGRATRMAERVMAALRERGAAVRLRRTRDAGHARAIAAEAAAQGVDRLVVAGGDGTINEAINGLAGARTPLAIVPGGTANVLAHELGWPDDPEAIADLVVHGEARRIDLGTIGDRRFVLMASVGLDAEVVARIDPRLKRRLGRLAYVATTLERLWRRYPTRIEVEHDGGTARVAGAIAAKACHYGGPFIATKRAGLMRPLFVLVLAHDVSPRAHLRYAAALARGALEQAEGISIHETTRVVFRAPADLPVQADGDLVGATPATIELVPDALTLVMPGKRTE